MPKRALRVLSVSDRIDTQLLEQDTYETFKDIDLILSCGDLPYYHLEMLFQLYEVPLLYVRGNHDPRVEYGKSGPLFGPRGGTDLHNRIVVLNGTIFAGFEGSLPYKEGPFLYSQKEMWRNVLGRVPRLLWNRLVYGRCLDVVITHSPPFGIHDQDDNVHGGFKAFRWLIKVFQPSYFFHGHIHVYTENEIVETILGRTKVINTYGHRKCVIRPGQRHYILRERPYVPSLANTVEDFRDARRQAALENIWSTLTGTSNHLIEFKQVEDQLEYEESRKLGLVDIPLDAIVGSVSRPKDFTRKFFPREAVDPGRWLRVKQGMDQSIRPIDVYQIDQVYFVLDGNHRVSVARQRGMTHIPANVTKIESLVPLMPDDNFEDMIIKNQQVRFRRETGLDKLRPDLEFDTSIPGAYQQLLEQIKAHQLQLEKSHHLPYSYREAVEDWVEEVYLPVLQTVSQSGLLRDFPHRTPTDLYLWLIEHQQELSRQYGWEIKPDAVLDSLALAYSSRLVHRWKRLIKRVLPAALTQPGEIGDWRRTHLIPRREGQIFSAILVAHDGAEGGWRALEQAFTIAKIEDSGVSALHIIREPVNTRTKRLQALQQEVLARAQKKGRKANLYIEQGEVVKTLNQRALWNDLLVFSIEPPSGRQPAQRLSPGTRSLVRYCPRPLLAVPALSGMQHGLLGFDGSPKATEALYLSAYLAHKWGIQLTVVSALEDSAARTDPLDKAREYLEAREIKANYHSEVGSPAEVILAAKASRGCDFLIVGGYSQQPVKEMLFGSTLDALLRLADVPVLICH
jgi:nucleotide-binding universal stress UspA family protein/Icc-related predicted phosphoesterase